MSEWVRVEDGLPETRRFLWLYTEITGERAWGEGVVPGWFLICFWNYAVEMVHPTHWRYADVPEPPV